MDYNNAKVDFVSGHTGTSLREIALVVSSAPLGLLLRNELKIFIQIKNYWFNFILDNVCLVAPPLLCFTVLCDMATQVMVTLLLTTVLAFLLNQFTSKNTENKCQAESKRLHSVLNFPMAGKRNFISAFRANVNLATAASILAVDFIIFPRRFCKAETYGTGLMDVGVGAYIISNAIVSPEARGKYPEGRGIASKLSILLTSIKSCTPLLILGVGRILSIKGVDYQEHVSEYGVHWNFFFTLACVRVLSSLVLCIFSTSFSWMLALVIGLGFQYLLDGPAGLKQFALHGYNGDDARQGLLEANREGLVSCLGYLAIYFAGVHLGKYLLKIRCRVGEWLWVLVVLLSADILAWICLYLVNMYEPVSRRLANLPFVIWMVAYSLQLLAIFLVVDIFDVVMKNLRKQQLSDKEAEKSMCMLEAVNYNGLFYFLLANVVTGMVNLSFQTVYMSTLPALFIVTSYMVFLSFVMTFLYKKNISFKFW